MATKAIKGTVTGKPKGWQGRLAREVRFTTRFLRVVKRLKSLAPTSTTLLCDDLEAAVDRFGPRTALIFQGRELTYAQLDSMANRYAHWATGRGIKRGDTVALFMPNRLEYVAVWYGLSKVGVATALINNNLTGAALANCLRTCGAAHLIADSDTAPAFEAVRGDLGRSMTEWIVGGAAPTADRDLDRTLKGVSSLRPTRETARYGLVARDVALYIFTSGATGLPKAAKVTHQRAMTYMRAFSAATEAGPTDRIYCALPLYHATGGLCAVGAALLSGGSLAIRKRFSASAFWTDIAEQKCTMFVYIGELGRYLVNQPEQLEERTPIKCAFGNGLRPDVWEKAQQRFKIQRILEFYGATEGNVSLMNLDGQPGAVGRAPPYLKKHFNVRLVRFDVAAETTERDARGFCIACRPGEVGEVVGEIHGDARSNFAGYIDRAATEKKVLHHVFAPGDAWFATGDLMRQDEDGYFYFIDRIGDTFRWKGENVSTTEVAEVLSTTPGVAESSVYGVEVPGAEGRAGMAALVTGEGFDIQAVATRVDADLPPYAQPVFLRLSQALDTTGTFKHRKMDLVADGFDPARVAEPLYYRMPGAPYAPLTADAYAGIVSGDLRL